MISKVTNNLYSRPTDDLVLTVFTEGCWTKQNLGNIDLDEGFLKMQNIKEVPDVWVVCANIGTVYGCATFQHCRWSWKTY